MIKKLYIPLIPKFPIYNKLYIGGKKYTYMEFIIYTNIPIFIGIGFFILEFWNLCTKRLFNNKLSLIINFVKF